MNKFWLLLCTISFYILIEFIFSVEQMWLVANGDVVVSIAIRCSLKYTDITPWRSQFRNFNAIPNTALSYWPTRVSVWMWKKRLGSCEQKFCGDVFRDQQWYSNVLFSLSDLGKTIVHTSRHEIWNLLFKSSCENVGNIFYSQETGIYFVPPSSWVQTSNSLQSQLSTALYWDETFRVKSPCNLRTIF